MNTKTLGQRLAQARKARGLSQTELAEMVGFKTQSGIGNLENRKDGRGGFSLPKIAAALNVTMEWLLNGPDTDDVPFIQPSDRPPAASAETAVAPHGDRERAIAIVRTLPSKGLKEALTFLDYLVEKHNAPSTHGARHHVPAPTRKSA